MNPRIMLREREALANRNRIRAAEARAAAIKQAEWDRLNPTDRHDLPLGATRPSALRDT